jgi:DNA primase
MDIFEIIQSELKITEIAGRYTKFKRSGNRSLGCCPLPNHNDSTPSFSVYPDAHAHCYGCGFHGDVIDFWAMLKGLQPGIEAALDLVREYRIQLPDSDSEEQQKADKRRQKEAGYTRQAEVYHQALSSHPNVVAYLEQRGFNEELRRRFLLGANRDGSAVVIPFWNRGRIQGLIRRQLYREPKYILPPKEDFPSGYKSLFIPGSTQGDLHIVEGYFDAMAIAALDLSAIAVGGTGISQQQKIELEKLKGTLYIFPDADDEGTKASREWGREFYPRARLCLAEYGEGRKDVADLFAAERERTRRTLEELKARAVDALDLSLSEAPKGSMRESYCYARDEMLPLLIKITDVGERNAAADDAAKVLGLKAFDLRRVLKLEVAVEGKTTSESSELVLHEPTPWPDPVDGAILLDEIAAVVHRFLSAAEHNFKAIALWTIYTYAFDLFDISPLLAITSPEKRCGKTTLLTLLYALAPRPLTVANITASALFRTVEKYHPTLLIAE